MPQRSMATIYSFGQTEINQEIILSVDKCLVHCVDTHLVNCVDTHLVHCVARNCEIDTFDDLRNHTYHLKSFQLSLEKLPCTSSSIHLHIMRAYLQCYLWLHAPFVENVEINPLEFGFYISNEELILKIIHGPSIPEDFSIPCNCIKCAKINVCPCRVKAISCEFCKCGSSEGCKNPTK